MKKNNFKKKIKESGQFMIEAVLLVTLFLGIAMLIKKKFKEKNMLGHLVAKPWKQISGMISNGVWDSEDAGYGRHPQGYGVSRKGDKE